MKISEHYLGYPKKTLIVVTNNELAKIFGAEEKEVEEIAVLKAVEVEPEERRSGGSNSAPQDIDEIKRHGRYELYKRLSKKLTQLTKSEYEEIVLCAPEAFKNDIMESMHTDIQNIVNEVVPKNLASLELDQIIRILQEKRPVA